MDITAEFWEHYLPEGTVWDIRPGFEFQGALAFCFNDDNENPQVEYQDHPFCRQIQGPICEILGKISSITSYEDEYGCPFQTNIVDVGIFGKIHQPITKEDYPGIWFRAEAWAELFPIRRHTSRSIPSFDNLAYTWRVLEVSNFDSPDLFLPQVECCFKPWEESKSLQLHCELIG